MNVLNQMNQMLGGPWNDNKDNKEEITEVEGGGYWGRGGNNSFDNRVGVAGEEDGA